MIFETNQNLEIKKYPKGMDRHVYLDPERALKLSIIHSFYRDRTSKKVSYNMLIKMSIDFLINLLEDLSEDEAIELLKELHKNAFF